jgi:hypothetical protein
LGADVTGDLAGALQLLAEVRSGASSAGCPWPAVLATSYVLLNADCDIDAAHSLIAGALAADDSDVEGDDEVLVGLLHSLLMICWTGGRDELWSDWHRAAPRVLGAARELLELCAGALVIR